MRHNQLFAIAGKGQGPLVNTRSLERPRLRVAGLQAGEKVRAETDQHVFEIGANGLHELHETSWIRCESEGANVVCLIVGRNTDAL